MKILNLQSESSMLGYPVLRVTDWESPSDLLAYIGQFQQTSTKAYVYTELSATRISHISLLEANGFRFSEFRIHLLLDLIEMDDYAKAFYPLKADLITEKNHLKLAAAMLNKCLSDDRFSSDPEIPAGFSAARNLANLEKSFNTYPDEWLVGLYNEQRATLEGFWSMGITDRYTAHLYQHALSSGKPGLPEALDALVFSYLKKQGLRWVKAISTGYNVNEINRLITNSGFKVTGSSIILRTIVA